MLVEGTSDSISFSNIKIIGLKAGFEPKFRKTAITSKLKGGYVMVGGSAVNPSLVKSDVEIAELLPGKKFTAVPTEVKVLPFKTGAWMDQPTTADLVPKTCYIITITE
jgi:hypothetical protein